MSIKTGQTRAHGESVAAEVTKAESEALLEPPSATLPGDRPRGRFRTTGFARMRTEWSGEDYQVVQAAKASVEARIMANFVGAYEVMGQVYDIVRTPEVDGQGVIKTDQWGWPIWARTATGSYDEDFTRLGTREHEHLLFLVTTRLFEWEQAAADAWGEAMFAKAQWEEAFAAGFDTPLTGTVDDRRAVGNLDSAEARYFAIFLSLYSRRADAIVRSMSLLGQRLKDSMTS